MYKQAILIRNDLKMPKGKMASQAAHASLESALKSKKEILNSWRSEGAKKVILKVDDKKELISYIRKARRNKLQTAVIKDAGHTFFKMPTTTAGSIGPAEEQLVDSVVAELKLL